MTEITPDQTLVAQMRVAQAAIEAPERRAQEERMVAMATYWPWEGRIAPQGVCAECGYEAECVVLEKLRCLPCAAEYVDQNWIAQYLLWKELRAIRLLLEYPPPQVADLARHGYFSPTRGTDTPGGA